MKTKKILYVTTIKDTIKAFLLPFAEALSRDGWVVDCMTNGVGERCGFEEYFTNTWDVPFQRNPRRLLCNLFYIKVIKRIVMNGGYDIVHVHTPIASFVTRLALKGIQQCPKIIYTAHGFHFHQEGTFLANSFFLLLEKISARWTDYIVTINREDYHQAVHNRFLPRERVVYIPGIGIDTNLYSINSRTNVNLNELKNQLGLPREGTAFLVIAEFNPGKRHIDILRALALLDNQNLYVLFAGEGRLKGEIVNEAVNLGISERVMFLGFRDDVVDLLKISSALILVSLREGLPRSVMEGMAMELPVIGTNIRGTRELLEGGCGILVPPKNVLELARAMQWIMQNPERAEMMGKRARERVKTKYDNQFVLQEYLELYNSALQSLIV